MFYRGPEGRVAALEDWCPHRGVPLSLGRVVEGKLVCGYHGLEMGCDGHTIAMPGQRVRGFPPVKAYPAVERHGFVWVWPGDAAKADDALIPHLHWADHPEWAYGGGLYHVKCDYRLMIDNLMDLTRETCVHATSLGPPEIDETPCTTKVIRDEAVTSRFMHDIPAPPFWREALRANGLPDDQKVDRWQICRFTPPSRVMIEVGVALAGLGGVEALDICSFELVAVDGRPRPPFAAGSHVDVQLPGGLTRPYLLANDPTDRHRYLIAVTGADFEMRYCTRSRAHGVPRAPAHQRLRRSGALPLRRR